METESFKYSKIGIVLSSVPGYSETFFRNKIKGLQDNGIEVILFVDYIKNGDLDFPCEIVAAPDFNGKISKKIFNTVGMMASVFFIHPKRSYRLYKLDHEDGIAFKTRLKRLILNQFLFKHSLDWLHFGFGMLANGRENVAKAMNAHMAVSFRGFDLYLSPLKHPGCYTLLFKKDVRYHVLSQSMKRILIYNDIEENNINVITPAIDTDFFHGDTHACQNNVLNIVTVARLHWIKGLDYTLDALAFLKENNILFKYTIIGEGEQLERLKYSVEQLNLRENVHFAGKLSPTEVKKFYFESDVYIQYSITEGFCNAALEAQAMGLLCIVSDVDGLNENVLNNVTGWSVPKRDPRALAEKIQEVVYLSQSNKNNIRQNAISRVKKEFTLQVQSAEFQKFYYPTKAKKS